MKYAVVTFGCRVNQADSIDIERQLRAAGGRPVAPGEAELVVDLVARSGRFAPHFHLPLQNTSDAVLSRRTPAAGITSIRERTATQRTLELPRRVAERLVSAQSELVNQLDHADKVNAYRRANRRNGRRLPDSLGEHPSRAFHLRRRPLRRILPTRARRVHKKCEDA